MAANLPEWLEEQADRVAARQRAQVETAKLMAIFIAGISVTFAATALQVGPPSALDCASVALLVVTLFFTWRVLGQDRLTEPDHHTILTNAASTGQHVDDTLNDLRIALNTSITFNEGVVTRVRSALIVQSISSLTVIAAAAVALLLPTALIL